MSRRQELHRNYVADHMKSCSLTAERHGRSETATLHVSTGNAGYACIRLQKSEIPYIRDFFKELLEDWE